MYTFPDSFMHWNQIGWLINVKCFAKLDIQSLKKIYVFLKKDSLKEASLNVNEFFNVFPKVNSFSNYAS